MSLLFKFVSSKILLYVCSVFCRDLVFLGGINSYDELSNADFQKYFSSKFFDQKRRYEISYQEVTEGELVNYFDSKTTTGTLNTYNLTYDEENRCWNELGNQITTLKWLFEDKIISNDAVLLYFHTPASGLVELQSFFQSCDGQLNQNAENFNFYVVFFDPCVSKEDLISMVADNYAYMKWIEEDRLFYLRSKGQSEDLIPFLSLLVCTKKDDEIRSKSRCNIS